MPSVVARYHGSGPSGYVNTSCIFICRCCAMTTILANKPRSALTTTSVAVDLTVLDLTRFPNVCKLDFGNGAYEPISFDFSLFSTKLTKAALPFVSAVSRSSVMLSVAFTADAMLTSGPVVFT